MESAREKGIEHLPRVPAGGRRIKRFGSVFAALVLLAAVIGGAAISLCGSLSNGRGVHLSAEE